MLLVFGINHKTAPVSLRERLSFSPDQINSALDELFAMRSLSAATILSTCNRTEIYMALNNGNILTGKDNKIELDEFAEHRHDMTANTVVELQNWLCKFHDINMAELKSHFYVHENDKAITHLMRVASGLDSLILGEPQIFGQVKDAYQLATQKRKVPMIFAKWFEKSFSVAKKVRTETDIGANAVSVAFAACSLAKQIFENLSELSVLLVGAGETIELVSRHLKRFGVDKISITNRTQSRAKALAEPIGANVFALEELSLNLHKADIIISSTASPTYLIDQNLVRQALRLRKFQPMLFIDIAVPRDIEANVGELDSVYLYTVDDLENIIANNQAQRQEAAKNADIIIADETVDFIRSIATFNAKDVVKTYRDNAELIRQDLIQKAKKAILSGADPIEEMEKVTFKLTQKLLHPPTVALQQAARESEQSNFILLSDHLKLTPP